MELLSKKVLIPSLTEQQAIGSYFSNLDDLITTHQEKISQLETLKKKLLQDMFIWEENKDHTLQLLIYYLMGRRSIHPEFQTIENLGIFNPRQNTIYQLPISEISDEVIKEVETVVIGY